MCDIKVAISCNYKNTQKLLAPHFLIELKIKNNNKSTLFYLLLLL